MRLATIKLNNKEVAGIVAGKGILPVAELNRQTGSSWKEDMMSLIQAQEIPEMTKWYNEGGKEEIEKLTQRNQVLEKALKESFQTRGAASVASAGDGSVTALSAGDKGKLVRVDNESMFAVVAFDDAAMKELKGENLDRPLPSIELGVKRPGFNGDAGEFVGRIRLRQEVKGKNYVVCDILGAWEQDKLKENDVLFAD